jgi:hypothetical protein
MNQVILVIVAVYGPSSGPLTRTLPKIRPKFVRDLISTIFSGMVPQCTT